VSSGYILLKNEVKKRFFYSLNAPDNQMVILGRICARMERSGVGIKAHKYYHSGLIGSLKAGAVVT